MVQSCSYCQLDTAGNHAWNCQLKNPLQIEPASDEAKEWGKRAIVESLERRITELEAEVADLKLEIVGYIVSIGDLRLEVGRLKKDNDDLLVDAHKFKECISENIRRQK